MRLLNGIKIRAWPHLPLIFECLPIFLGIKHFKHYSKFKAFEMIISWSHNLFKMLPILLWELLISCFRMQNLKATKVNMLLTSWYDSIENRVVFFIRYDVFLNCSDELASVLKVVHMLGERCICIYMYIYI